MNADATITFTPFDVRFSRWLYQDSGWSKVEQDQALAEYLEVRALEDAPDDPAANSRVIEVIEVFDARRTAYEASLMAPDTFRRHAIAFYAGWRGNSVAALVALVADRLGGGGDFAQFAAMPTPGAAETFSTHSPFSLN